LDLNRVLGNRRHTRRQATHELVASVLREAITTGQLKGNQPLPQDEIAAQLRVSHIPVREALRQLESEGLVTYQPNRGATVTDLSLGEIREIYDIRAILETAAVREAAPRLSREELAQADGLLDRAESTSDGAAWGSMDVDFHELVYHLQARPRLKEIITGLLRRVDRYWLSHGLMLKYRERFDREHRALLAALEARDAEAAGWVLEAHLRGACDLLIAELGSLESAGAAGGA
jgi:DNA-binding GntR family transcriptional regulator